MKIDKFFTDIMNNPLLKFSIFITVCIFLIISIYLFVFPVKEGLKKPKNPLAAIMKPITSIITTMRCTIRLVISIPQCFLYYMLDTIGFIFYLPFSILFWILGASKIEKKLWKGIDKIDSAIYNQSGFHIFHYTNSVMNKCYRCIPKKTKKFIKKSMDDMSRVNPVVSLATEIRDTPKTIGNAILLVIVIMVSMFLVMFFAANLFGITLFTITSPLGAVVSSAGDMLKKTYDSTLKFVGPVVTPDIGPFKSNPVSSALSTVSSVINPASSKENDAHKYRDGYYPVS